jgi:hypothetical protein
VVEKPHYCLILIQTSGCTSSVAKVLMNGRRRTRSGNRSRASGTKRRHGVRVRFLFLSLYIVQRDSDGKRKGLVLGVLIHPAVSDQCSLSTGRDPENTFPRRDCTPYKGCTPAISTDGEGMAQGFSVYSVSTRFASLDSTLPLVEKSKLTFGFLNRQKEFFASLLVFNRAVSGLKLRLTFSKNLLNRFHLVILLKNASPGNLNPSGLDYRSVGWKFVDYARGRLYCVTRAALYYGLFNVERSRDLHF